MAASKQQGPRKRKRPDVSFNFGANAKPKRGKKGGGGAKAGDWNGSGQPWSGSIKA